MADYAGWRLEGGLSYYLSADNSLQPPPAKVWCRLESLQTFSNLYTKISHPLRLLTCVLVVHAWVHSSRSHRITELNGMCPANTGVHVCKKDFLFIYFYTMRSIYFWTISCPLSKSLCAQMLIHSRLMFHRLRGPNKGWFLPPGAGWRNGGGGLQSFSTWGKRLLSWVCSSLSSSVLKTGRGEQEEKIGLGI